MLVDNAPYLEHNIRQCLETYFWKNVCLDSLERYEQYKIYFYRKTKYLTLDFKEGGNIILYIAIGIIQWIGEITMKID